MRCVEEQHMCWRCRYPRSWSLTVKTYQHIVCYTDTISCISNKYCTISTHIITHTVCTHITYITYNTISYNILRYITRLHAYHLPYRTIFTCHTLQQFCGQLRFASPFLLSGSLQTNTSGHTRSLRRRTRWSRWSDGQAKGLFTTSCPRARRPTRQSHASILFTYRSILLYSILCSNSHISYNHVRTTTYW